MIAAYVLVVKLTLGGTLVLLVPDLDACIARSQFEVRFDAQVMPICVPWSGDVA